MERTDSMAMNTMDSVRNTRLQAALLSLEGLSVGDAFGQLLSISARSVRRVLASDGLPGPHWLHTDDTQMAMAIVEELAMHQRILPASLADRFVRRYQEDSGRGYGKGARIQLEQIAAGEPWEETSANAFNGRGSKGNGSAMRVAPLGAYFAADLDRVVEESRLSSIVTHAHPEGIAGGIAVAVAAAVAWNHRSHPIDIARAQIWESVLRLTPEGETLEGLRKAAGLPYDMAPEFAARLLGSGFLVTAPDTVPFAVWCATRHLNNYREAIVSTLEGDGDCDTNCAIVGGIVAMVTGLVGIPEQWLTSREPLNLDLSDLD